MHSPSELTLPNSMTQEFICSYRHMVLQLSVDAKLCKLDKYIQMKQRRVFALSSTSIIIIIIIKLLLGPTLSQGFNTVALRIRIPAGIKTVTLHLSSECVNHHTM